MPQSPLADVVSHWHHAVENFATSPRDFYASVEEALERRKLPRLKTSRVTYDEGGMLSARREYLRLSGDRHWFDICAAPFGTGFFFSNWVAKKSVRFLLLHWLAFAVVLAGLYGMLAAWIIPWAPESHNALVSAIFGSPFWSFFIFFPACLLFQFWGIALLARGGITAPEMAVMALPILGRFYEPLFSPNTYYRIDTMLMFQSVVHTAVLEVVNSLLQQKGLRALTESERAPIFRELVGDTNRARQHAPTPVPEPTMARAES